MDLLQAYHEAFDNASSNHDFTLIQYSESLFVGKDLEGNVSVVIISSKPNRKPLHQKTRLLSVECNAVVKYSINNEENEDVVHIIRCFADTEKERDIFIELTPLFGQASRVFDQESSILETVAILSSFFADNKEPSYTELEGLFVELYTIWSYNSIIKMSQYWQSEDRMKFDFSITEKDKIEVKATEKNERRHHFRHEQLLGETFNIYIISYMLRKDDEGLSLYELMGRTKPLLEDNPKKMLIIDKYIKNVSEEKLRALRFNEYLIRINRKVFKAEDIPRFSGLAPTGVTNAEYDCHLDNANGISEEQFVNEIDNIIKDKNSR